MLDEMEKSRNPKTLGVTRLPPSVVKKKTRTGASERIVLAHCSGTCRGCVPSGEVVGASPSMFPAQWQEGSKHVFLMVSTCGRLLVLGGNPLHGSDALDSRMGACLWDLSLGQRTGDGRFDGEAFWGGLLIFFLGGRGTGRGTPGHDCRGVFAGRREFQTALGFMLYIIC